MKHSGRLDLLLWLCSIMINGRTWRQREKKHTISLWTLTHAWMIAKTLVFRREAKSPARDTVALEICFGQSNFFVPAFISGAETVKRYEREKKQIKARVVLNAWVVTTMAPIDLWVFGKKRFEKSNLIFKFNVFFKNFIKFQILTVFLILSLLFCCKKNSLEDVINFKIRTCRISILDNHQTFFTHSQTIYSLSSPSPKACLFNECNSQCWSVP